MTGKIGKQHTSQLLRLALKKLKRIVMLSLYHAAAMFIIHCYSLYSPYMYVVHPCLNSFKLAALCFHIMHLGDQTENLIFNFLLRSLF